MRLTLMFLQIVRYKHRAGCILFSALWPRPVGYQILCVLSCFIHHDCPHDITIGRRGVVSCSRLVPKIAINVVHSCLDMWFSLLIFDTAYRHVVVHHGNKELALRMLW